MLKIYYFCFNGAVYFSPSTISGMVVVEFRMACVRSSLTCIATYSDDIFGGDGLSGNNSVVS